MLAKVSIWEPSGKNTRCTKHDLTFPRGHSCPICTTADAVEFGNGATDEVDDGRVEGCPTSLDHERWLVRASRSLWRDSKTAKSVSDKCKLIELALKCRKNAMAQAVRREDWAETKRLENEIRKLSASKETAREVP
jgi:hypothetical protein